MTVNPPEPDNFPKTVETTETQQVVNDHPDVVYLDDIQSVQLEIYRATTENRKPDFSQFTDNAVRAAGWDKKKRKPLGAPEPGEPYKSVTEQSPIENEITLGRDEGPSNSNVESDAVKLGQAKANDPDNAPTDKPADQTAQVLNTPAQHQEQSNELGAAAVESSTPKPEDKPEHKPVKRTAKKVAPAKKAAE